jgi:hypothetical protein
VFPVDNVTIEQIKFLEKTAIFDIVMRKKSNKTDCRFTALLAAAGRIIAHDLRYASGILLTVLQ